MIMPPPRVNYKDLPKEARDRIDRQTNKQGGVGKKEYGPKQPSQKEREKQRKIDQNIENVKDRQQAEERGTTSKDFKEMKKRQDAEKKAPAQPSKTEKAKNWIQERGRAIAHETRDLRPRHNPMGNIGMGLPGGADVFGVGKFGGIHNMMGADPFHEMQPRRTPAPQRKKKRKAAKRRAPSQSSGMPPMLGGGIPSHMKWMFGQ
jgi:hypothetical protein